MPTLNQTVEACPTSDDAATPGQPVASDNDLRVPEAGMLGLGRDFADLYATYLESPRAFFYFAFLTYFGALVSKFVTLDSELNPEPRLYTVLLGESADTRKSTALSKADEFFRLWKPPVLFGVGSAEGVAAELKEKSVLILHFDELKTFVDKAKAEHSVALPMVSTLFERSDYDNRTKSHKVTVRGASLSLVAACTKETYATMFDKSFHAIGFLNRLWLVTDRSRACIPMPETIPPDAVRRIQETVSAKLQAIYEAFRANNSRPVRYPLTPGALGVFEHWYRTHERSIFARRLDTYGHRLMLLLAATSGKTAIDEHVAEATVALLAYQLDVRRECDPVDAESMIAALEEKIRRALAKGPLRLIDLKRKCNYARYGLWAWDKALENLKRAREVELDPSGYRLAQS